MADEKLDSLGTRTTAPMLFCEHCANLLYPECSNERSMLWRCNYCKTTEIHDDCNLVYVLNLKMKSDKMGETEQLAEFASDPTAQRDPEKHCPKCGGQDVTCFVNPLGQQQEDMTLFFACANRNCRFGRSRTNTAWMHFVGVSVQLVCLYWHFLVTVLSITNYCVYLQYSTQVDLLLKRASLAFSIIELISYGAVAAPLLIHSYKYSKTPSRRTARLQGGIATMFLTSSLPMTIIGIVILLSRSSFFDYPLDTICFFLHCIGAIFGFLIAWFSYMRLVANALQSLRGPERQMVDEGAMVPSSSMKISEAAPAKNQPDVI